MKIPGKKNLVFHHGRLRMILGAYTKGFTILELLVSTAILLIITGMLLSIFNQSSNAWIAAQQDIERHRSARMSLGIMNRELSQALMSTSGLRDRFTQNDTTNAAIDFFGFSNSMFFIATGPADESLRGDMYEIGYTLDAGSGKLYRHSTPAANSVEWNPRASTLLSPWIYPDLTNSFLYTSGFEPDSLMAEGVVDLKFVYSDTGGVTYTSWSTTNISGVAHVPAPAVLPTAVDIQITVMPVKKFDQWKSSGSAAITNTYSRIFQTTVNINNRRYR